MSTVKFSYLYSLVLQYNINHDKWCLLCVRVCVHAMTCMWTLTLVHWRFKSAATPGRSETCGCVALCQRAVCVFLNMCLYVCLFIPTFVHLTPLCCTSEACLSFCSPILSHFLLLWWARSLDCGHTFTHFCTYTQAKNHCAHTFAHTHTGAGQHVLNLFRARTLPFAPFCMGRQVCSISHAHRHYLLSAGVIMNVSSLLCLI